MYRGENNRTRSPLRDRTPSACSSAPQGNQCLISHFLASLGAQEQTDIAQILHINVPSMLWSVGICQNSVSADKYKPDCLTGSGIDWMSAIFVLHCKIEKWNIAVCPRSVW